MIYKKTSHRVIKVVEAVKTCLLSVLVITLIVLVVVYIRGTRVFENAVSNKDNPGESFDKLFSVLGGKEPEGLDSSFLIPEFIGFKQSTRSTSRACVGDNEAASELYSIIKPCIIELFGKDSTCRRLSQSAGERLFSEAQNSEEFVYLSFHEPVLYQLIYAYAADTLTVSAADVAAADEDGTGAYVSELIIIPDNDFASHRFIAYAYDPISGYFEFRPSEYVVASDFYISKLSDNGEKTVEFEFGDQLFSGPAKPLVSEQLTLDCISIVPASVPGGEQGEELLRFFGYNPDKLDVFVDEAENSYVYIDSHSRLKIGEGIISFVTSDAYALYDHTRRGIAIDDLLGYSNDGISTLFDKLTAADNLIGRLGEYSSELIGGDGTLCLGEVYSEGPLLVIEYLLTYENVVVRTEPHMRFVFTDETVCEIEINSEIVKVLDASANVPEPGFVLKALKASGSLSEELIPNRLYLCYTDGEAEWKIELAG